MLSLVLSIISTIFLYVSWNVYKNLLLFLVSNVIVRYLLVIAFTIFEFLSIILCMKQNTTRPVKYLSYMFLFFVIFMLISFLLGDILVLFRIRINKFYATLFTLIFAIIVAIYGYINRSFIRVTNYRLDTNKNVKLKIAFLSDIHIGAIGTNEKILNRIVERINEIKPDVLLFGGDIVEAKIDDEIRNYCKILSKAKAKFGSYGVLGNHEFYVGAIENIIKVLEKEANIKMLNDDFVLINNDIILVGRQDSSYSYISGKERKTIGEIVGTEDNRYKYKIVVDHNPKYFDDTVKNNFDLQLSGHTHNGQFFPFNLVVKLSYEKAYGLLKKLNSILIVSSGAGTWGPPVKVLSKPEIVVVDLE